jgi:hypothetical protein
VLLPISAPDAIEPAFRHAKEQLLRPFRFGQWTRLAFVGLLAGEMSSFGGCNFNYPLNTPNTPHIPSPASHAFLAGNFPWQLANHAALFGAMVLALIVVGIGLLVLFTYIGSVMRFILFDSIVARECHIRAGWTRRKEPGFRLFVWRLLFMLATLAALLIVIGIPVGIAWAQGWFTHARDHVLVLVLGGIALFLVFFALLILVAVINVMTKDFVVPQMALENIGVMEGWRRLWEWIKNEKGGYAGYIGIKIVLAIGATIALLIVTVIAMFAVAIILGLVGVAAFFGGKVAGWTWNPYTIALAVVLGCAALAILIFVAALIAVPVIVFFPAYSIYFLAPRYSPLASLLQPEPQAPVAPG